MILVDDFFSFFFDRLGLALYDLFGFVTLRTVLDQMPLLLA